ncbi:DUF6054 family protein [Clostridium formicaceticum]|uniref:Uncharacterized protein n=1 Tax=Clostridium formicaceticum TaxID=1497 RepID=A0AAC9RHB8_9CLOT|nr:DUF6054 family protein [Clostridium formicaceticum]AOY76586.1 hypothetical protein BJL90_12375 [Clostridium formicaceticum]ARE87006.1 hypothetical protein CLFO_13910 [Clostridium formicaceticum]
MSKYNFTVSITPKEALALVKKNQSAELVHEELFDLGEEKFTGTIIFEKYYFRAGNRAALIVIADNLKGKSSVRSIATGSSQGLFFNFDWGASDDFAYSIKNILKDFIVKEEKLT